MKAPRTFLWHDYETFGADPMIDRPAQFAALRTDTDLEPVEEPLMCYCAPADDVLPHPAACMVTGITPQAAREKGEPEAAFAARIEEEMMRPGTCSVGYNSIRFDDLVTRNLFYRNLRDPYAREYKNGNSRWDLIDLARMCYAIRPDGIEWPMHEPGKPSFRLEDLTAANGIGHEGAHDALADVHATIGLARLIREKQPRLFEWGLQMRDQPSVSRLLDTTEPQPVLHSSSRIPANRGCTSLVLPLAVLPDRPKHIVVFDLAADPEPLLSEPAETIHDLVFTPSADMPEGVERLPLKIVRTNGVPMVAPLGVLKGVDQERIGLNEALCRRHATRILPHLVNVRQKVIETFSHSKGGYVSDDPDRMLYSGDFFTSADRRLMDKIIRIKPADLGRHQWSFQDGRLHTMLFRFRARNYPETLNLNEAMEWDRYRRQRLLESEAPEDFTLTDFQAALDEQRTLHAGNPGALSVLDQLESWVDEIGLEALAS
ncbi:MAG: exodeoxyribonuclease I [Xanthomonadales bacterium]|jgi:exodeoxyribonuclease-1|nr:exodeoxyribonuclease I [Xanthomonadales bacterium]